MQPESFSILIPGERAASQAVYDWVTDACVGLATQMGMHNATVDQTTRLVNAWLAKNRAA